MAKTLIKRLHPSNKPKDQPILSLAFDEAHTLTGQSASHPLSPFYLLRRVLRSCRELSLFAIFLSTTGEITQFVPPKEQDPSTRMQEGLLLSIPPFCTLGWDQCRAEPPCEDKMDLPYVSSLAYKARLGRPL